MPGYIFDLDGTLLDSLRVWEQVDADFFARRGMDCPDDYIRSINALSFRDTAEYTIKRFGLEESPEQLMAEWFDMAAHAYGHTVQMKPHAKEYLHELKRRDAQLAIATSCSPGLYMPALERHGITHLFDAILCTDDVANKDKPDIYLEAARRLDCPPEQCVVFEDLLTAIKSAKAAGMTVYAMYDEQSRMHWDEIGDIADGRIYDFADAPLP